MHNIFKLQNCRGLFHNVPDVLAIQQKVFVAQGFLNPLFMTILGCWQIIFINLAL